MTTAELIDAMFADIGATLRQVDPEQIDALQRAILSARRVFIAGKGRSGLQMRAFAMRLMHLGLTAHVVDEVTTPAIEVGDLLLVGSSSGRTRSLVGAVEALAGASVTLAAICGNLDSPIARAADCLVYIPATNFKTDGSGDKSILVMGALFEHCLGLCCDLLVIRLKAALGVPEHEMNARHANIE
ncbi:MAG: SIS domain-containing protein [Chloroflexi bacterium]|nr:SIS domain-containing protein [Chloroflexota bacterium]MXX83358.1 SIS domain-containing protein [Chloroflexota bacterium]MYC54944.1 SIS domain-containing protein [Chloroflexota bacterium]MYD37613.1 SIS domain-containing protein [Chloroflexota bacterium]MYE78516.1 SIS domain-containing protein [Chloroflexota bacterium]